MSTLHTFKVVCVAVGLPMNAPVIEIPGHAIIAAEILRKAIRDNEPTEQERAEFGHPTPWWKRACEE